MIAIFNVDPDRPAWEFELFGQNPFNWILNGVALLSAAEGTYQRYSDASRLHNKLFARNPTEVITAIDRVLTGGELEILPDLQLGPVSLMLGGFGLENLMKALIVHSDPSIIQGNVGLPKSLKEHRLERLARRCALEIDAETERGLRAVSQFVIWAGRYPIPTRPLDTPTNPFETSGPTRPSVDYLWRHLQVLSALLRERVKELYPHVTV